MSRAAPDPRRIAVTGIGMSTPLGGRAATWDAVRRGRSALARLPAALYPGAERDAGGLPPLEERSAHRERHVSYALRAASEACQDAGLDATLREDAACVLGTSKGGTATWEAAAGEGPGVDAERLAAAMPGWSTVIAAERLGLGGPRLSEAASCATGAACLRLAASLMRRGECVRACAGASDASLTPLALRCYRALGVLAEGAAPAQACRPFAADRRGFLPAEGAGALVLEWEADARRRGARIYGLLLAAATASDGYHETSPHSKGEGLVHALLNALDQAGARPEDVDFVLAHGTATLLGDAAEAAALRRVFAASPPVAATKPQTGHLLGASSAVEAGLALLALRDGFLPPVLNAGRPDPACGLPLVPEAGMRADLRLAVSLSAGFGGQAGALVLRRPEG